MSRSLRWTIPVVLALVLPYAGCDESGGRSPVDLSRPVQVDLDAPPPKTLSSYNFFSWDPEAGFTFNERVVPYDLNTALFSDYALKQRAIYVPEGAVIHYDAENPLDLPVGSVVIKSFFFPADFRAPTESLRIVETRVLVRHADGWHADPYIWDANQRDARLSPSGEIRDVSFIDATGAPRTAHYLIPQRNDCSNCHTRLQPGGGSEMVLIGVKARHLNRAYDYGGDAGSVNQLEHLEALGMLDGLPDDPTTVPAAYDFRPIEAEGVSAIQPADLDFAARSYLDVNCAHCHNPRGAAGVSSQLFLNHDNVDLFNLGRCKMPGSAGHGTGGFQYDIVPGSPATSILRFRVETEQVGAMMPVIGRSLRHDRGTELLTAWIAAMPAATCP